MFSIRYFKNKFLYLLEEVIDDIIIRVMFVIFLMKNIFINERVCILLCDV